MSKKKDADKFTPYTAAYIGDLLKIVKGDVQDNTPISGESYLSVALKACENFNEALGDQSFDKGV